MKKYEPMFHLHQHMQNVLDRRSTDGAATGRLPQLPYYWNRNENDHME